MDDIMTGGFDPMTPDPRPLGYDWGEGDLIRGIQDDGWLFFVQYAPRRESNIQRREQARAWMNENKIPYSWVGGRSNYEFAFREEQHAVMFKLAFG
jgi:hypothetical protein